MALIAIEYAASPNQLSWGGVLNYITTYLIWK